MAVSCWHEVERDSLRKRGPLRGSSYHLQYFEPATIQRELNPIKPAYDRHYACIMSMLTRRKFYRIFGLEVDAVGDGKLRPGAATWRSRSHNIV